MRCGCPQARRSGVATQAANLAEEIQTNRKNRQANGQAAPYERCWKPPRGLPDLLKARREVMEARWRGEMAPGTRSQH